MELNKLNCTKGFLFKLGHNAQNQHNTSAEPRGQHGKAMQASNCGVDFKSELKLRVRGFVNIFIIHSRSTQTGIKIDYLGKLFVLICTREFLNGFYYEDNRHPSEFPRIQKPTYLVW